MNLPTLTPATGGRKFWLGVLGHVVIGIAVLNGALTGMAIAAALVAIYGPTGLANWGEHREARKRAGT